MTSDESETRIRFGIRRYPLGVLLFVGFGVGFLWYSGQISEPTYVFPVGLQEPEVARFWLRAFGVLSLGFIATLSTIRFWRRPAVVLRASEVEIPVGEFGWNHVTLTAGEVRSVRETKTAAGWRKLIVEHAEGTLELVSSQLPDDESFERARDAVLGLRVAPAKPAKRRKKVS